MNLNRARGSRRRSCESPWCLCPGRWLVERRLHPGTGAPAPWEVPDGTGLALEQIRHYPLAGWVLYRVPAQARPDWPVGVLGARRPRLPRPRQIPAGLTHRWRHCLVSTRRRLAGSLAEDGSCLPVPRRRSLRPQSCPSAPTSEGAWPCRLAGSWVRGAPHPGPGPGPAVRTVRVRGPA